MQKTARVREGNGAGAVPHLRNVDGRHAHEIPARLYETAQRRNTGAELVFVRARELTVVDQRGGGRGAAHVENDQIVFPSRRTERPRPDDAGRSP